MKKIILTPFIAILLLASCSNQNNNATEEATHSSIYYAYAVGSTSWSTQFKKENVDIYKFEGERLIFKTSEYTDNNGKKETRTDSYKYFVSGGLLSISEVSDITYSYMTSNNTTELTDLIANGGEVVYTIIAEITTDYIRRFSPTGMHYNTWFITEAYAQRMGVKIA